MDGDAFVICVCLCVCSAMIKRIIVTLICANANSTLQKNIAKAFCKPHPYKKGTYPVSVLFVMLHLHSFTVIMSESDVQCGQKFMMLKMPSLQVKTFILL